MKTNLSSHFAKLKKDLGEPDRSTDPYQVSQWTLARYLESKRISAETGLNILQRNGVVSDVAVSVTDVYSLDQVKAVEWMEKNVYRDKYGRLKVNTES